MMLKYPKTVKRFLANHGASEIKSIIVCRKPIDKMLKFLANTVTLGLLQDALRELDYDEIFHLYMYITLKDGTSWRVEKNLKLEITKMSRTTEELYPGGDCLQVAIRGNPSMNDLFRRAYAQQGDELLIYDAVRANCQRFIKDMLKGSLMLTAELQSFIEQKAEKLLPKYLHAPVRAITDFASRFR